ncbi:MULTISPECIES: hypothetical protein [Vibrio]|uniref:Fimbrial protein n=1 Tax=Vibrio genomosp. F6 str. FF-238 TaxID=1191298 RepID=A0A1E5CYU9_9VIBR|nr:MULTISPECIES: hypothetical protein [Vibrio]NOH82981.1 Flp family type IVb pilin [Vibrio sp. 03-59-1]OEE76021.1 fimbrial protein [Vibrio genomosp. F6 str. FF-238]RBW64225.1 Flp family type IVb pilin [Vibrionales bacterium C3R12]
MAWRKIKQFLDDETGLTVVEYVVAAGLLVGALTTLFVGYGDILSQSLSKVIG